LFNVHLSSVVALSRSLYLDAATKAHPPMTNEH